MKQSCAKLNPDSMTEKDIKDAEQVIENTIEAITNSTDIPLETKKDSLQKLNEKKIKLKNISSLGKTGAFYLLLGIFSLAASGVKSLALDEKEVYKNVVLTRNSMLSNNFAGSCSHLAGSQTFNGVYNINPKFNIPIQIINGDLTLGTSYVDLYREWNSYLDSLSGPEIKKIKKIKKAVYISDLYLENTNIKFINYFDPTRRDHGINSDAHRKIILHNFNTTEGDSRVNVGINYKNDLFRSSDPNFSTEYKPALIKLMKLLTDTTIPPDKYYGGGAIAKKRMTARIRINLDDNFNFFQEEFGFIPDKIYTTSLTIASIDGNFYSNGRAIYTSDKNHALVLYMRLIDGKMKYGIMDIQNLYGDWDEFQSFSENGEFDGNPIGIFEPGFWKEGDLFYEKLANKVVKFDDPFLYLVKTWADKDGVATWFPSVSVNYNFNTLTSEPPVSTLDNFIAYTWKLGQAYIQANKKGYISKWHLDTLLNYNKNDKGKKAFDWLFESFLFSGIDENNDIIPNKYKTELIKWYLYNENDILSIPEKIYYKQLNEIQKLKERIAVKYLDLNDKLYALQIKDIITPDKYHEFKKIIDNSKEVLYIDDDLSNIKLLTDNYKILMQQSKEIHQYLPANIKPYKKIIEVYDKIKEKIEKDPSLLYNDGFPDKENRYYQWKRLISDMSYINKFRKKLYTFTPSLERLNHLISDINMIYSIISHDINGNIIDPAFKLLSTLEPEKKKEENISTIITRIIEWLTPLDNTLLSNYVAQKFNSNYEKTNKINTFYKNFEETELSKIGDKIEQSLKREESPKYIPFEEPKQSWFQTTRKWLGWGGIQKSKTRKRKSKTRKRKRRFSYKK